MRILIISNLFPPYVMGGAEMAAHSLAGWLAGQGHAVHVLTSAPTSENGGVETRADGLTVERRLFPNLYPVYQARETRTWRKLLWHARDHHNPASEAIVKEVIERFRPDLVNLHDLQGIGYNLLREVGRQKVPCVQVMHDFGFVCINMNMFVRGEPCRTRHWPCVASAWLKRSWFAGIERLAFWFPTEALRESYRPHLPPAAEVFTHPFPLLFSAPSGPAKKRTGPLRLLYAGQVTPPKGVAFLLEVLRSLAAEGIAFRFTVVGDGESLPALRKEYAACPWVRFAGRVPPEEIADFMNGSDALVIPSLWRENSPLVARQAVQMGLPVLGSAAGGLPEIVTDGVNGALLEAGHAGRWRDQLRSWLRDPQELERLRQSARPLMARFAADHLGAGAMEHFQRLAGKPAPAAAGLASHA